MPGGLRMQEMELANMQLRSTFEKLDPGHGVPLRPRPMAEPRHRHTVARSPGLEHQIQGTPMSPIRTRGEESETNP